MRGTRSLRSALLVSAADPHVSEGLVDKRVLRTEAKAEELSAADAVVLLTDHAAFDYSLVAEHARFVLDCRRRLAKSPNVEHL